MIPARCRYVFDPFTEYRSGQCPYSATHQDVDGRNCCDTPGHGHPKSQRAATVIVLNCEGEILSISRGLEDIHNWNLLGGKVDPEDLTDAHAAAREAREEGGVILSVPTIVPIYRRIEHAKDPGGKTFLATTFIGQVMGFTNRTHGHEGHLAWKKPSELLTDACVFAEYNSIVFRQIGLI